MPRGHEHDPIYSHHYLRALFEPIFLLVFLENAGNGKKYNVVPFLDVMMIAFFPEKNTLKFSFPPKKRV